MPVYDLRGTPPAQSAETDLVCELEVTVVVFEGVSATPPPLQTVVVEQPASSYNDAIQAIENTSTLCQQFPTRPPAEQRRLLQLLVDKATWKTGELETTLRAPFQQLRLSNHGSNTKQTGNDDGGPKMKTASPRRTRTHNPSQPGPRPTPTIGSANIEWPKGSPACRQVCRWRSWFLIPLPTVWCGACSTTPSPEFIRWRGSIGPC